MNNNHQQQGDQDDRGSPPYSHIPLYARGQQQPYQQQQLMRAQIPQSSASTSSDSHELSELELAMKRQLGLHSSQPPYQQSYQLPLHQMHHQSAPAPASMQYQSWQTNFHHQNNNNSNNNQIPSMSAYSSQPMSNLQPKRPPPGFSGSTMSPGPNWRGAPQQLPTREEFHQPMSSQNIPWQQQQQQQQHMHHQTSSSSSLASNIPSQSQLPSAYYQQYQQMRGSTSSASSSALPSGMLGSSMGSQPYQQQLSMSMQERVQMQNQLERNPYQPSNLSFSPPSTPPPPQSQQMRSMLDRQSLVFSDKMDSPKKSDSSSQRDRSTSSPLSGPSMFVDTHNPVLTRRAWKPVGKIYINVQTAGPDDSIEVSWEIPSQFVHPEMFRRQPRHREVGDTSDDKTGDWIGLFRSRQRIDVIDGHILTREVSGRIFEDNRTKLVRGSLRLRTPRGVGTYDFRYFRGTDYLSTSASASDKSGDDQKSKSRMLMEELPLARSAPIRVEIQGYSLFEALDFISKNIKDRKKIPLAIAQLAALVHQIRTLRYPLGPNSSARGGSNGGAMGSARKNQNGKSSEKKRNFDSNSQYESQSSVEEEIAQEQQLIDLLGEVLTTAVKRGVASEQKYEELINQTEDAIEEARKELEATHLAVFGTPIGTSYKPNGDGIDEKDDGGDLGDIHNNEMLDSIQSPMHKPLDQSISKGDDEGESENQKEYQKKKQTLINHQKTRSLNRRERSTLSGALRWMLEEVTQSQCLNKLLPKDCLAFLAAQLDLFCSLEDVFFVNQSLFDGYLLREHKILGSRYVRYSPIDPRSREYRSPMAPAQLSAINYEIDIYLVRFEPGDEFYLSRRSLLMKLQKVLDSIGARRWCPDGAKLLPFGSSANGFAEANSDLDLCLKLDNGWERNFSAVELIERIAEALKEAGFVDIDDARKTARIPLVRFSEVIIKDNEEQNIHCDICINNLLAVRNTFLLRTYGSTDIRVIKLIRFVKHWAKARGINNPSEHTLSSYGYILMVINFLQRQNPPVLPVLQAMPKDWTLENADKKGSAVFGDNFDEEGDNINTSLPSVLASDAEGRVHETYFFGDPEDPQWRTPEGMAYVQHSLREYASRNESTLIDLISGFFWDIAFGSDWRRHVVSVRTGRLISKEMKASTDSWKIHPRIAIEDPFEVSYDVAHVLRDSTYRKIRKEAARAFAILNDCYEGGPTDIQQKILFIFEGERDQKAPTTPTLASLDISDIVLSSISST